MYNLIKLTALGVMAVSICGFAHAQKNFTVEANKTKQLKVRGIADSVVIGDPRVADVGVHSVQGGNLIFITGRSFGTTNLLVFDAQGKQLYSGDIAVTTNTSNLVSVNRAGATNTYDCAPRCRSVLAIGDDFEYFTGVAQQNDTLQELNEDAQ